MAKQSKIDSFWKGRWEKVIAESKTMAFAPGGYLSGNCLLKASSKREPVSEEGAPRPMRALMLKKAWLDQILQGIAKFDIRARRCSFHGQQVYLCEAVTGKVLGKAAIGESRRLTENETEHFAGKLATMKYKNQPWAIQLTVVATYEGGWRLPCAARKTCPQWVPRSRWEKFQQEEFTSEIVEKPGQDDVDGDVAQPKKFVKKESDQAADSVPPVVEPEFDEPV